jgi:hypothetical protein
MTGFEEERLAELLALLPPAPSSWVTAAQELPRLRAELDSLVARAEADAAFRRTLVVDLASVLRAAGIEPTPAVVEDLRRRLER